MSGPRALTGKIPSPLLLLPELHVVPVAARFYVGFAELSGLDRATMATASRVRIA
jgi:hypothetical protein